MPAQAAPHDSPFTAAWNLEALRAVERSWRGFAADLKLALDREAGARAQGLSIRVPSLMLASNSGGRVALGGGNGLIYDSRGIRIDTVLAMGGAHHALGLGGESGHADDVGGRTIAFQPLRHIEHELLLGQAVRTNSSGIVPAVSGVHNDFADLQP